MFFNSSRTVLSLVVFFFVSIKASLWVLCRRNANLENNMFSLISFILQHHELAIVTKTLEKALSLTISFHIKKCTSKFSGVCNTYDFLRIATIFLKSVCSWLYWCYTIEYTTTYSCSSKDLLFDRLVFCWIWVKLCSSCKTYKNYHNV